MGPREALGAVRIALNIVQDSHAQATDTFIGQLATAIEVLDRELVSKEESQWAQGLIVDIPCARYDDPGHDTSCADCHGRRWLSVTNAVHRSWKKEADQKRAIGSEMATAVAAEREKTLLICDDVACMSQGSIAELMHVRIDWVRDSPDLWRACARHIMEQIRDLPVATPAVPPAPVPAAGLWIVDLRGPTASASEPVAPEPAPTKDKP
jgi:hypothetical protein